MIQKIFIYIFLLCSIACAATPDISYSLSVASQNIRVGEVLINNKVMIKTYDTVNGRNPYIRAEEIAQRLTRFIAMGYRIDDIAYVQKEKLIYSYIGKDVLFEVTEVDAQYNNKDILSLFVEWQSALKDGLKDISVSDVKVSDESPEIGLPVELLPLSGYASWYQDESGKFFAIHSALPDGTKVRVRNLENGWTIVVEVIKNESLPVGRVINLSYSAARALGIVEKGIAKVKISRVY